MTVDFLLFLFYVIVNSRMFIIYVLETNIYISIVYSKGVSQNLEINIFPYFYEVVVKIVSYYKRHEVEIIINDKRQKYMQLTKSNGISQK